MENLLSLSSTFVHRVIVPSLPGKLFSHAFVRSKLNDLFLGGKKLENKFVTKM